MRRRLTFMRDSLLRGLYQLTRLYGLWVAAIAVVLVVLGVTVPPILNLVPLSLTAPIGVVLLAAILVEGAFRRWAETDDDLVVATKELDDLKANATAAIPPVVTMWGNQIYNNGVGVQINNPSPPPPPTQ